LSIFKINIFFQTWKDNTVILYNYNEKGENKNYFYFISLLEIQFQTKSMLFRYNFYFFHLFSSNSVEVSSSCGRYQALLLGGSRLKTPLPLVPTEVPTCQLRTLTVLLSSNWHLDLHFALVHFLSVTNFTPLAPVTCFQPPPSPKTHNSGIRNL